MEDLREAPVSSLFWPFKMPSCRPFLGLHLIRSIKDESLSRRGMRKRRVLIKKGDAKKTSPYQEGGVSPYEKKNEFKKVLISRKG